ncbi:hypothetical protein [Luteibacter pinisoli]|uniref:hypothetical protein n=1 Tax=Luteibacter pinisoli TaxID=2589080 RepID=UPI0014773553|nr:hypothetical protein [Luteibacter pinisoli]
MSDKDSKQHSANGVGGSNNPAANPGQDKPASRDGDQTGQKPREGDPKVDSSKG